MIEAEARAATRWELSPEGAEVLRDGSAEVRLFRSLPAEGLPQSEAMVRPGPPGGGGQGSSAGPGSLTAALSPQKLPGGSVGFSKAMANKWLRLEKGAPGGPRVFRAVSFGGGLDRGPLGPGESRGGDRWVSPGAGGILVGGTDGGPLEP